MISGGLRPPVDLSHMEVDADVADTIRVERGDLTFFESSLRGQLSGPELYRYVAVLDAAIALGGKLRGEALDKELTKVHEAYGREKLEGRDWLYDVTKSAERTTLDNLQLFSNLDFGISVGASALLEGDLGASVNPFGFLRDLASTNLRSVDSLLDRRASERAREAKWAAKQAFDLGWSIETFAARILENPDIARSVDRLYPDLTDRWTDVVAAAWYPAGPPVESAVQPKVQPPGLKGMAPAQRGLVMSCQQDDGSILLRVNDVFDVTVAGFEALAQDLADSAAVLSDIRAAQEQQLELARRANQGVGLLVAWANAQDARETQQRAAQERQAASEAIRRTQTVVLVAGTRLLSRIDPEVGAGAAVLAETYLEASKTAGEVAATFSSVAKQAGDFVGLAVSGLLLAGNVVGIAVNVIDAVTKLTGAGGPSETQQILTAVGKVQQMVADFARETFEQLEHLDTRIVELHRTVLAGFDMVDRRLRGIETDLTAVRADILHVRGELDRLGETLEWGLKGLHRAELIATIADVVGRESRTGEALEYPEFTRAETQLTRWALDASKDPLELPLSSCPIVDLPARLSGERPLADQLGLVSAVVKGTFGAHLAPLDDLRNPVTWSMAAGGLAALVAENPRLASKMPACVGDLAAVEEGGRRLGDALASFSGRSAPTGRPVLKEVSARYEAAAEDTWASLGRVQTATTAQWCRQKRDFPQIEDPWTLDALARPGVVRDSLRTIIPAAVGDPDLTRWTRPAPERILWEIPAVLRCQDWFSSEPLIRLEWHMPESGKMLVTLMYRLDSGLEWRSAVAVMTWTVTLPPGVSFRVQGDPSWSKEYPWGPRQWRWAYRNWAALNWQTVEKGTWVCSPETNVGFAPFAINKLHHDLLSEITKAQQDACDDPSSPVADALARLAGYRLLLHALINLTIPRGLLVDNLLHALLDGPDKIFDVEDVRRALTGRQGPPPKTFDRSWRPPEDSLAVARTTAKSRLAALKDRLTWQVATHASLHIRDCPPDLDLMTTVLSLARTLVISQPKPPDPSPPQAPAQPNDSTCRYLVRAGDSWWGIAERLYGDGRRFKQIQTANPTTTMLHPGDLIVIPWQTGEATYAIAAGDGFWAATRAIYGRADRALVAQVVTWNGGDETRKLHIGDVLYCPR